MFVGLARVPSEFTVNLVYPSDRLSHSCEPSGEYVGPSWPTSLPLIRRFADAELPTSCCTLQVLRSTMTSAIPPSVTEAATWVPSGLTVEDMILPGLMTRRSPIGLVYWSAD